MTIATVVERGFGGSASDVATRGYTIGAPVTAPPDATLTTRGFGANATIGGIVTRFYSIGTAVVPTAGGGAGRPSKSPERRKLYEHRPNYDAVAEAYREAEERARELEAKKRKKALAALKIAEDAIEEARESRSQVNLAQLTGALEATAKARAVLDIVEQARRSADIARLLIQEMQDEEEAEMLLLTH